MHSPAEVSGTILDRFDWRTCERHGSYAVLEGDEGCWKCQTEATPASVQPGEDERSDSGVLRGLGRVGVNGFAYRDATLETFDGSRDPHVMPRIREWLAEWKPGPFCRVPWLYLFGAGSSDATIGRTGNGKTHIAVALMRHLVEEGMAALEQVRFTTAEEILIGVEDCRSESRPILPYLKELGRKQLLVIDDLGTRSHWSDNTVRMLVELSRLREGRATIWTSNLSPKTLGQDPNLRRIVSRLTGETRHHHYSIEFAGPDRRLGSASIR